MIQLLKAKGPRRVASSGATLVDAFKRIHRREQPADRPELNELLQAMSGGQRRKIREWLDNKGLTE